VNTTAAPERRLLVRTPDGRWTVYVDGRQPRPLDQEGGDTALFADLTFVDGDLIG
jgi:hypothetical protein